MSVSQDSVFNPLMDLVNIYGHKRAIDNQFRENEPAPAPPPVVQTSNGPQTAGQTASMFHMGNPVVLIGVGLVGLVGAAALIKALN